MLLSDYLLSIISPEPTSYLDFSDINAREPFERIFQEKWQTTIEEIIDEYYNLDEEEIEEFIENNPNPLTTYTIPIGFRAVFDDPYIIDCWDSRAWPSESSDAICAALLELKKRIS